ncbi:MAG: MotA/TolQ/ExbB proton channel family protein [Polyangiales bacterium]
MGDQLQQYLTRLGNHGGTWVLWVMVGLSVLSISIIAERIVFYAQRRDDIDVLGKKLIRALRKGDHRAANAVLEASPSVEAKVLRPVLDWLEGGTEAVSEIVEAELGRSRRDLERGLTTLGTIGNNAPFVGLLGTVLGVMKSFGKLAGGAGQQKGVMDDVMKEIGEALIATGVGLFVALPAVVAYNIFQKRVGDVEANVHILSRELFAFLKSKDKLHQEFRALGETPDSAAMPVALRASTARLATSNEALAEE